MFWRRWTNPLRSADRDTVIAVMQGYEAMEAKDWPRAGDLLASAAARLEGKSAKALWFDAALAYKFARDWPRAYETGKVAVTYVKRGAKEPAYWNLGTAAAVLRDWQTARDAWAGCGLQALPGSGQIDADLGSACSASMMSRRSCGRCGCVRLGQADEPSGSQGTHLVERPVVRQSRPAWTARYVAMEEPG